MKLNLSDYIGKSFKSLTPLLHLGKTPKGNLFYCKCACGNDHTLLCQQLRKKNQHIDCGCGDEQRAKQQREKYIQSQISRKVKSITIIDCDRYDEEKKSYFWLCLCENCGAKSIMGQSRLHLKSTQMYDCCKRKISQDKRDRISNEGKQICSQCERDLDISCFSKLLGGYRVQCKECIYKVSSSTEYKNKNKIYRATSSRYKETRAKYREENINYKLTHRLRGRFNSALFRKKFIKSHPTLDLLGCTIEEFKIHIEKQFTPEMNWENQGSYWHIDHIRACCSFDLRNIEQQKQCFHYSNMRPLFWLDNLRKSKEDKKLSVIY